MERSSVMEAGVVDRYRQIQGLVDEIVQRLQVEVETLGFAPSEVSINPGGSAQYRLEKDPSSGEYALVGDWYDARGGRLGSLMFHADGSFFVEHDVVRPHPRKRCWFVEAVNAWGRGSHIKAEARLLPMPE